MSESCPLCLGLSTSLLHKGGKASGSRDFIQCDSCDLVFVPRSQLLTSQQQNDRYLEHNNDVDDPEYRKFLGRLYNELKPYLVTGAEGLDYGSGPGPALVAMMREDGFDVDQYDIFFHSDEAVLKKTYDFITCTETAEHFSNPESEFQRLFDMMREPAWLGIMTGMLADWSQFPDWYYHHDPTHVNFFSKKTMSWISEKYQCTATYPADNVVLFRKG